MKTDHTFTFTAAVILAGVALAFVNPADAIEKASPVASTLTTPSSAFAAVDSHNGPALGHGAKHNHPCDGAKRAEHPTNS